MLSNTLNTNEVKGSAGTEIEFEHRSSLGRTREFQKISESPSAPYRLQISHQETGKGLKLRRRSVVRFNKTVVSDVDSVTPVTVSAYAVADNPQGALTTTAELANVLANLMSFLATTGSGTTVLFDCTGNGAKCLLDGSL